MAGAGWRAGWIKAAALAGVVGCLGLPVNEFWRFLVLLAAAVWVIGADGVRSSRRLGLAAAIAVAVVVARAALVPGPGILEGHGVIPFGERGALPAAWREAVIARGLAPEVFESLAEEYVRAFPGARPLAVTGMPFAYAADGFWQTDGGRSLWPVASRRVDAVNFTGRAGARIGAFNSHAYQYYMPDEDGIRREQLPFFLMYDIPAAYAGGRLCWRGDLHWIDPPAGRERHDTLACQALSGDRPLDRPLRVLAVEVTPGQPLAMVIAPPPALSARLAACDLLAIVGVVAVLGLVLRWRLRGLALPAVTAVSGLGAAILHAPDLLTGQILFEGGNDGLTYAGFAREILIALTQGDLYGALGGGEAVYYFMPGYRYVMAAAAVVGGDTLYGILLAVCLLPLGMYRLLELVLPMSWARVAFGVFLTVPALEAFGFWNVYGIQLAVRGFGEPVAYGALVWALVLLVPGVGGWRRPGSPLSPSPMRGDVNGYEMGAGILGVGLGGLAVALAVFIRPNLAPGAAVLIGGCFVAWGLAAVRGGPGVRRAAAIRAAALSLGLAPVLLVPLHNWVYGGVLVPFTASAGIPNNLGLSPAEAARGLSALLEGVWGSPDLLRLVAKLRGWVAPYEVWRQAALAAALWVLLSARFSGKARIIAAVALVQHPVLFFYQSGGRYGHLTWSLTLITLLIVLAEIGRTRSSDRVKRSRAIG